MPLFLSLVLDKWGTNTTKGVRKGFSVLSAYFLGSVHAALVDAATAYARTQYCASLGEDVTFGHEYDRWTGDLTKVGKLHKLSC
jgi:hypothetical protein